MPLERCSKREPIKNKLKKNKQDFIPAMRMLIYITNTRLEL